LNPNPIRKVLSTLQARNVKHLLMGGQACVFYGAAEFSRDTDIAILADAENFSRLEQALADLKADVVAVPPMGLEFLYRGHAIHFRCRHPDAEGMRLDVMSVLRGVEAFSTLWSRRTTAEVAPGEQYEIMALADLVAAKKTQRDKDWPMIRRLIEADYQKNWREPEDDQIRFWFREARTPELLKELSERFPAIYNDERRLRSCLMNVKDPHSLDRALQTEESLEREKDKTYWLPLKKELEGLRRERR